MVLAQHPAAAGQGVLDLGKGGTCGVDADAVLQRDLQDFNYAVQSAGLGIRYRTPVGPIRLDLALSPNPPRFNGFRGTTAELQFGCKNPITGQPVPCQTVRQRINIFQFHFSLGQAF